MTSNRNSFTFHRKPPGEQAAPAAPERQWKSPALFLAAAAQMERIIGGCPRSQMALHRQHSITGPTTPYVRPNWKSWNSPGLFFNSTFSTPSLGMPTPGAFQGPQPPFRLAVRTPCLINVSPITSALLNGSIAHGTDAENAVNRTNRSDDIIVQPTENDVVLEGANPMENNTEFRRMIRGATSAYDQAATKDKPLVVDSIVRSIKQQGGRFLRKLPFVHYMEMQDDERVYKEVAKIIQKVSSSEPTTKPPSVVKQADALACTTTVPQPQVQKARRSLKKLPTHLAARTATLATEPSNKKTGTKTKSTNASHGKSKSVGRPVHKKRAAVGQTKHGEILLKRRKKSMTTTQTSIATANSTTTSTSEKANMPQLAGVRISVTKAGTFEARYYPGKKPGEKKPFPMYIATRGSRNEALQVGNQVARQMMKPNMDFLSAKEAIVGNETDKCGAVASSTLDDTQAASDQTGSEMEFTNSTTTACGL